MRSLARATRVSWRSARRASRSLPGRQPTCYCLARSALLSSGSPAQYRVRRTPILWAVRYSVLQSQAPALGPANERAHPVASVPGGSTASWEDEQQGQTAGPNGHMKDISRTPGTRAGSDDHRLCIRRLRRIKNFLLEQSTDRRPTSTRQNGNVMGQGCSEQLVTANNRVMVSSNRCL